MWKTKALEIFFLYWSIGIAYTAVAYYIEIRHARKHKMSITIEDGEGEEVNFYVIKMILVNLLISLIYPIIIIVTQIRYLQISYQFKMITQSMKELHGVIIKIKREDK